MSLTESWEDAVLVGEARIPASIVCRLSLPQDMGRQEVEENLNVNVEMD